MRKLLIVEDSETYHKILAAALVGYEVTFVKSAEEAAEKLAYHEIYDGLVVDINLPNKNGFVLLKEILLDARFDRIPIFCLSSREDVVDKVMAFNLGVDDYITKPFDPTELRARIDNKMKKSLRFRENSQKQSVGNIIIDPSRRKVMARQQNEDIEIFVTPTEFKLLYLLAIKPEQVFSREEILKATWGENLQVHERVVDVHMCLLRKKLSDNCSYNVRACSGVGYKLTKNLRYNANLKKLNTV